LTIGEVTFIFRAFKPSYPHFTSPHWGDEMEKADAVGHATQTDGRNGLPDYEKPSIRMMDEKEVLSAFQVTVAATTWWVM